jgi:hypothetical protein
VSLLAGPGRHYTTSDDPAPDLRLCRCRSKDCGQEQKERLRHPPRSGGCGKVIDLEDSHNPGSGVIARLPCDRRFCRECRPRVIHEIVTHYLAKFDGYPMRRRTVDKSAWGSLSARLRRGGHFVVRVPAPDGSLTVWATGGTGEVPADVAAAFAADVAACPAGQQITTSREWARTPVSERGTGRWKARGMLRVPVARAREIAHDLGLYVGEVEARALPDGWAEGFLRRIPDDDLTRRRWKRWTGLYRPDQARDDGWRAA